MERGDQKQIGNTRAEIATRIVRPQSEYYGKGPTKTKAYITEDVVVVVLEETFTKAERTLVERGETETIRQIRRRFQQAMADEFKSIVEQATGRVVRAFLRENQPRGRRLGRVLPARRSTHRHAWLRARPLGAWMGVS
jgi:uncharacterized protein YbcI